MPRNQFQRMVFAFLTVLVTVHAYVFFSLYVVNGNILMSVTGASSVLGAVNQQGGVYMCGSFVPIWAVVLVEFCLAYLLEVVMGSPCSFKLASKIFNPAKDHPMILLFRYQYSLARSILGRKNKNFHILQNHSK